jgi:hypothetical protein
MATLAKTLQKNNIMQKACKIMIQNNIGSVIVIAAAHSIMLRVPSV